MVEDARNYSGIDNATVAESLLDAAALLSVFWSLDTTEEGSLVELEATVASVYTS